MPDTVKLDGHHRSTVEKLFRHPTSHNIEWHDVISLLQKVATVVEGENGRFTVTLGEETQVFDEPRHHDCDIQQVIDIRRMLDQAAITPETTRRH